jgi:hypothetical protein
VVCHVNIWFEQTIVLNDFTLVGKVEVPDFVSLRLNVYFTFFFAKTPPLDRGAVSQTLHGILF